MMQYWQEAASVVEAVAEPEAQMQGAVTWVGAEILSYTTSLQERSKMQTTCRSLVTPT